MSDKILQHASVANGAYRKNLLINGGFDIWQRGESFLGFTGTYTADRWIVRRQTVTGGTVDVTRVTDNTGSYLKLTLTALTNYTYLEQKIENLRTLAGRRIAFAFDLENTAAVPLRPRLVLYYGSGGTPSATETVEGTVFTAAVGSTRHVVVFDVPSIAGKTLGTDNNSALGCRVELGEENVSAPPDGSYTFGKMQVEFGDTATDFEHRPIGEELALCQRYYYKSPGSWGFVFSGSVTDNQSYFVKSALPVTMRASPFATVDITTATTGFPDTADTIYPYPDGITFKFFADATITNTFGRGWITADAEL